MKKIFISFNLILIIIVAFSIMVMPQTVRGVDYSTMRDITAFDLVSEMNVGINIGNSFDSVGNDETAWGNPKITKDLIKKYKSAGFNTIRLPVTWAKHIDSNGTPNTTWLNRVKEVTDWILSEDLYCIINTHHEGGWLHTSSGMTTRRKKFKTLWTSIANTFKNYGDRLLFEGFNEIQKVEGDWSQASESDYNNANILLQDFVDAVRATGGNNALRTLIVSTYGAIHTTYGFELPTDTVQNRLAVEFHCYYPQEFCFEWGSQKTWGSKRDLLEVESYCLEFSEFVKNNIPVILGEFGAVNKSNTDARAEYAKTVMTNCNKYGIKAIWWDNGTIETTESGKDAFCLIDRSTYQIALPSIVSALVDNAQTGTTKVSTSSTISQSATSKTQNTSSTTIKTQPISSLQPTSKSTETAVIEKPYIGKASGFKAVFTSANTVKLSWDYAANAESYKIYRQCENSAWKDYKTIKSNILFDVVKRGKTYKYKIVPCVNINGTIFYSENVSTKKVTSVAKSIKKVTKSISKTKVTLNISRVVGATNYEVKYSNTKAKGEKVKTSGSNKITLKNLKKNTKYFIRIRAYKKSGSKKFYTSYKSITVKTKK